MTKAPKLKKEDGLIDWTPQSPSRSATRSGRCSRGRRRTPSSTAPGKPPVRVIIMPCQRHATSGDGTASPRPERPRSCCPREPACSSGTGELSACRDPGTATRRQEAHDRRRVPARPPHQARRPLRPGDRMRLQPAHFTGHVHTARTLALQVLLDCRNGDAFVQEVLDAHLTPLAAEPRRPPADDATGLRRPAPPRHPRRPAAPAHRRASRTRSSRGCGTCCASGRISSLCCRTSPPTPPFTRRSSWPRSGAGPGPRASSTACCAPCRAC